MREDETALVILATVVPVILNSIAFLTFIVLGKVTPV